MAKVASNSSLAKRWILKMLFNGCVVSLQEDWNYQREWWPKYFKAGMVGMLRTLGLQTMVLLQHVWMALPVSSTYLAHPRTNARTHTHAHTHTRTHTHAHTHSLSFSLSVGWWWGNQNTGRCNSPFMSKSLLSSSTSLFSFTFVSLSISINATFLSFPSQTSLSFCLVLL